MTATDAPPNLIRQPHGGALLPPCRKGETRNPDGRLSNRDRLARAYAERVGLRGLLDLARRYHTRRGEVHEALLDAACGADGKGINIAAQALLWRLLGQADQRVEMRGRAELQVEVIKRRIMDDDDADAPARDVEARVAQLEDGEQEQPEDEDEQDDD